MKRRILRGWTFVRALYTLVGLFIIIQSFVEHEWIAILFGGYFASMGIFGLGCAAGNCFGGACYTEPKKDLSRIDEIQFEEVKNN